MANKDYFSQHTAELLKEYGYPQTAPGKYIEKIEGTEREEWNDGNADTRWYKAKLQFITIDERTEKEKRQTVYYLVEACSLHNALDNIDIVMRGSMVDYVQANVGETQILDVFEHENKAARLMTQMAEELRDPSKSVEEIADKYVHAATPELRQQLIDKLTDMRKGMNDGKESD